jgi:hypothetical protein
LNTKAAEPASGFTATTVYVTECGKRYQLGSVSISGKIFSRNCTAYGDIASVPAASRLDREAARLLRLWVRMPPGAWTFVCCECCVLSGVGLCDELITRPEESYRLWCVVVCDLETS